MSFVPTFNEFGLWYFVFGIFTVFGFVMLAVILLAEPDAQYAIEEIESVESGAPRTEIKNETV